MGNELRVKFWHDKWCGDVCFKEEFPRLFRLSTAQRRSVRLLVEKKENSENWVFSFRRQLFVWEDEELIRLREVLRLAPSLNLDGVDKPVWFAIKSRQSFVSTLYNYIVIEAAELGFLSRSIWVNYLPPKVQFFGWLAWKHKVKTCVFLQRIGILDGSVSTDCVFCKNEPETIEHVLILCPMV